MTKSIDLNADLGEGLSPADERELMELVTSASIACGGHAGTYETMQSALATAVELGVRVGAHPSYPDKEGFGRVSMKDAVSDEDLFELIVNQCETLGELALAAGTTLSYVKPHGALYNDAATDPEVALGVARACMKLGLPLMFLGGAASPPGVEVIREGFIDRRYDDAGLLMSRDKEGALIDDPAGAARQALSLAESVDTLCVHSDTPGATQLLQRARSILEDAGYVITA